MNMQKMLKDMQKMQSKMARAQEELEKSEYSAEAGGGAVKITLNGKGEMTSIRFDPEVVDPDDVEALEDLVQAAYNTAHTQKEEQAQGAMGSITQGMKLPGM